jgi:hypothetical protein
VIEEIRYDFTEHPKQADDFIRDLIKLMIISKMNSTFRNHLSRNNFINLIKQIPGCEAHIVKYGRPILYVKYKGMEFTDQKVTSQFVRINGNVVDVTVESVFGEFVRNFDKIASTPESRVTWGIVKDADADLVINPLFVLLNLFINAVNQLTLLDPHNPDSLMRKKFGIRNANVIKNTIQLEFTIDGQLNIMELNASKKIKDHVVVLLLASSQIAKTLAAIMKQ